MAYRIYVSEALRIVTENTAKSYGGSYLDEKFSEIISGKQIDNRSGDEIVSDIINRAGIEVIQ